MRIDATLLKALALSLVLHALLLAAGVRPLERARDEPTLVPSPQLEVSLRPRIEFAELEPDVVADARRAVSGRAARKPSVDLVPAKSGRKADEPWQSKVRISRELLYPPEAIAQGLEGDAVVLLVLDEAGDAIAARLESSSGHALLDEAAVRAVRTLRGLPESAPREVLLPVRFRLH